MRMKRGVVSTTIVIMMVLPILLSVGCSKKNGKYYIGKYNSLKVPDIIEEVMESEKPKQVNLVGLVFTTFPSQHAVQFTDIHTAIKYACCADCVKKAPKLTVKFEGATSKLPAAMALIEIQGEVIKTENNEFILKSTNGFKFLETVKSLKELQM